MRRLCFMLLCAFAGFAQTPAPRPADSPTALRPDPDIKCEACPAWNAPRQPFKVFGNTYYVGSEGLSSMLITGDEGLILIDVALPQSAPLIDANIRALGFRTTDIKLILTSHAHYDHVGGVSGMQRFTRAAVAGSQRTVDALALGHPTPDDPQFMANSDSQSFPAVSNNVRVVEHGETLRVGGIAVTAHYTPGHTPGATSWTWRSCEGTRCLSMAYVDSLTAVSNGNFKFTGDSTHPGIVETFRLSLRRVADLPCDVLLTTHPSASGMDEKLKRRTQAGPDPLIDAEACKALAERSNTALDARVKEEMSSQPAAQRATVAAPYQLTDRPMPNGTDLEILLPRTVGTFSRAPVPKGTKTPVEEDLNVDYTSGADRVNVGFSIPGNARDAQDAIGVARDEAIATLKQGGRAKELQQAQDSIGPATSYYKVHDFIAWSRGGYFYYAKANTPAALDAFMRAFPF